MVTQAEFDFVLLQETENAGIGIELTRKPDASSLMPCLQAAQLTLEARQMLSTPVVGVV